MRNNLVSLTNRTKHKIKSTKNVHRTRLKISLRLNRFVTFAMFVTFVPFVTFAACIPQAKARFYSACLVSALVLLHEEGILHRNVTPNCVYITDLGYVQLADFTCAKKMDGHKVRYKNRSLHELLLL